MASNITRKRKRFIDEYLKDLNGTQAAIRAGYSKNSANVQAAQLLALPSVKAYLAEKEAIINARLDISADRIKKELARVAFQDVRQFYDEAGNLIPIHMLNDDAAAALAGMEVDEIGLEGVKIGVNKKIKRFDKVKALELLGKSEGIFEKDNDQKKNETVVTPFTDEQVDKIITSLRKTA
jgi:phage terminase small subunit